MVKFGMPPVEALKAATVNAADLLGVSAEAGTIEPGKSADIIAVTGDPLSRRHRPQEGRLRHGARRGDRRELTAHPVDPNGKPP